MPITLYLVRHGRTLLNAEGRLRGLADPPLDEVGLREAEELAQALASSGARVVATSRLVRARRTAQAVAQALGVRPVVDPGFLDRDYGPQTGRSRAAVEHRWGSVDRAPGVESTAVVLDRVRAGVERLFGTPTAGATPVDTAVVVTHDAVIRPFLRWVEPHVDDPEIPTGSWCLLTADEGRWRVELVDQKPGATVGAA